MLTILTNIAFWLVLIGYVGWAGPIGSSFWKDYSKIALWFIPFWVTGILLTIFTMICKTSNLLDLGILLTILIFSVFVVLILQKQVKNYDENIARAFDNRGGWFIALYSGIMAFVGVFWQ